MLSVQDLLLYTEESISLLSDDDLAKSFALIQSKIVPNIENYINNGSLPINRVEDLIAIIRLFMQELRKEERGVAFENSLFDNELSNLSTNLKLNARVAGRGSDDEGEGLDFARYIYKREAAFDQNHDSDSDSPTPLNRRFKNKDYHASTSTTKGF